MNYLSNDEVVHVKKNGVEYIQFKRLLEYEDRITHCFTLKPLDFKIEDNDKVLNEYDKICKALDIDSKNLYRPSQTHSNNVKCVNDEEPGIYTKDFQEVDGLITDKTDKILSLTFADCTPLFFFDPVKNVIGNIHSGWRGTYQEIAKTAVRKFVTDYGVNVKDLICVIGPSICGKCFEVDEEIAKQFADKFNEANGFRNIVKKFDNKNKYLIDTELINRVILNREGLSNKNIISCGLCTKCFSAYMHSVREDGEKAGRNTALIMLK